MSMTAGQRWRKDKPTRVGMYRWRRYSEWKSFNVDVRVGNKGPEVWWEGYLTAYLTDEVVGEWCGPLEPPHDQEAG